MVNNECTKKRIGRPPYFNETEELQLLSIVEENKGGNLRELGTLWVEKFAPNRKPPSSGTVFLTLQRHGYRHKKLKTTSYWTTESETRYQEKDRLDPKTGYPSDLSDEEWNNLQEFVERPGSRGPKPGNIRQQINAMLYISRTGCQWRYLPKDFPPWNTVAKTFYRWKEMGVWDRIHDSLRGKCRQKVGREKQPTMGIIDAQVVKTTEKGGQEDGTKARRRKGESVT
jgi:putative transposase